MPRRPSLAAWIARHTRPTDGPGAGRQLALEPWQRGFLQAVDRERKPIVSLMAASQLGKTLLALGIGIREAVDGQGVLMASSTEVSVRDLARRLDSTLEHAPAIARKFPVPAVRTRRAGVVERSPGRRGRMDRAGRVGVRLTARVPDGQDCAGRRGVTLARAGPVRRGSPARPVARAAGGLGRRRASLGYQLTRASRRRDRLDVSRWRSPPHGIRLPRVRPSDTVRMGAGGWSGPWREAANRLPELRGAARREGPPSDAAERGMGATEGGADRRGIDLVPARSPRQRQGVARGDRPGVSTGEPWRGARRSERPRDVSECRARAAG